MLVWIKRILKLVLNAVGLVLFTVLMCNLWVTGSTAHKIYEDPSKLPYNEVGVVLGTSKRVADGDPNQHFQHRMTAAARLYEEGKIDHLLVSGHGDEKYYNEPRDMKAALVAQGVPESAITADRFGLRTWDSMVRAHGAYGLERFTVISDGFHVGRAVFIARRQGAAAVAFAAEPVELKKSMRSRSREWLARVKAVMDVFFQDAEEVIAKGIDAPIEPVIRRQPADGSGVGADVADGELAAGKRSETPSVRPTGSP